MERVLIDFYFGNVLYASRLDFQIPVTGDIISFEEKDGKVVERAFIYHKSGNSVSRIAIYCDVIESRP
jgi:hypothetical protein